MSILITKLAIQNLNALLQAMDIEYDETLKLEINPLRLIVPDADFVLVFNPEKEKWDYKWTPTTK